MSQTALGAAVARLQANGIPHALCGAIALSAFGVPRATGDLDLLVADPRVLEPSLWSGLGRTRAEVRRGDDSDPLHGLVRIGPSARMPVDIVVPKGAWVRGCVERATRRVEIGGVSLPIVEAADLVLLKLYAGGFFDQRDIASLLAGPDAAQLRLVVEQRIGELPRDARRLWETLRGVSPP